MRITKTLLLALLVAFKTTLAQEVSRRSALEFPRTEVVPIADTRNNRAYELYVRLPEGYSENTDKYHPVIYYTDAMWHVETLSGSAEYIMEDAILVGISWQVDIHEELKQEVGAHVSRYRDYSFREHSNQEYQTKYHFGQADKHLVFIRETVIPYVERNYRTKPDQRTYFGYSMSGEFGAYIMLSQPGVFKNYILGSPSLRSEDITELSEISASQTNLEANVFISHGSLEERLGKSAKEFIAMLQARNDQSLQLNPVVIEGSHQTAFPMTAVEGVKWVAEISSFPELEGPYFGQKTPGLKAEIFAPNLVSLDGRFEGSISFSSDLKEMYFEAEVLEKTNIYHSKLVDGQWRPIEKMNFTKEEDDEELHPFVSPDGQRIYFTSHQSDEQIPKIWFVNHLGNAWSSAERLDSPINDDVVFYPNQSRNGDMYYFNLSKFKTYYATNQNGKFPQVRQVDISFGHHGFISPTQDYLLVAARNQEDSTRRDNDIYVYFREEDRTWSKPINLGEVINTNFNEKSPSVSPDGKYLFFGRDEREVEPGLANIYWVSTEVIDRLRP